MSETTCIEHALFESLVLRNARCTLSIYLNIVNNTYCLVPGRVQMDAMEQYSETHANGDKHVEQ